MGLRMKNEDRTQKDSDYLSPIGTGSPEPCFCHSHPNQCPNLQDYSELRPV